MAHVLRAFEATQLALEDPTEETDLALKAKHDQARERSDLGPAMADELAEALKVLCTIASQLPGVGHQSDAAPVITEALAR